MNRKQQQPPGPRSGNDLSDDEYWFRTGDDGEGGSSYQLDRLAGAFQQPPYPGDGGADRRRRPDERREFAPGADEDAIYRELRRQALQRFDEDYRAWRCERARRFAEAFEQWRRGHR